MMEEMFAAMDRMFAEAMSEMDGVMKKVDAELSDLKRKVENGEVKVRNFVIKDGKLLPPFVSVSGLGETAAWDICSGREGRAFVSIEEFAAACPKVSKTHIENLRAAGAFGTMPETSQITLF